MVPSYSTAACRCPVGACSDRPARFLQLARAVV